MTIETKIGLCRMCEHDQCQVKCEVEDEVLKSAKGMPRWDSPMQPWMGVEGCPKIKGLIDQVYNSKRLNYPQKRVGKRGENRWEKISWDQALDEIAEKLGEIRKKYGAEALGILFGLYNNQWDVGRFGNLFGTPNKDSCDARICGGTEAWMNILVYGGIAHYGPPNPAKTELLVLWGNIPSITNPIKWERCRRIPRLIVVDPRRIDECARADMHLQIRPGTDTALALGWLNIIINKELYDKEFVEKWTIGFEGLRKHVQKYTPETVSKICEISKNDLIDSAVMYGTIKPAFIQWGSPIGYSWNGSDCEWARCILRAISGNLEIEGGNQIVRAYSQQVQMQELELHEMLPEEQMKKAIGSDTWKGMTWPAYMLLPKELKFAVRRSVVCGAPAQAIVNAARTGKPYPIKAMILGMTNIMASLPNTKHTREALENLELLVVYDVMETPTAALADYKLPATMWLEGSSLSFLEHGNYLLLGQKVLPESVEGKFDRRDTYNIWKGLGTRLGQEKYWPWKTLEEVHDYRLRRGGRTWKEFEKEVWVCEPLKHKEYEKTGRFLTRSGKVELSISILNELGYQPYPEYQEPPESPVSTPDIAKKYPYIMVNKKTYAFLHTGMRMSKAQRKLCPYPMVEINPETAKKEGIKEGDWVLIESPRGKIKQKCLYNDIPPNTICGEFGWWFPEMPAEEPSLFGVYESNVNVLTSDEYFGPYAGNWHITPHLAKISRWTPRTDEDRAFLKGLEKVIE